MSKEQQNVYVVEVDMKNKSVEDIARESGVTDCRNHRCIDRTTEANGSSAEGGAK